MANPVGRPEKGPRKDIHVRVPEHMLLELYAFNPQMLAASGGTRYGAVQEYLLNLMRRDLEEQRARVSNVR